MLLFTVCVGCMLVEEQGLFAASDSHLLAVESRDKIRCRLSCLVAGFPLPTETSP